MKKKMIITTTILAVLTMGIVPVRYVYATGNNWRDVIYPGVYIENIDVSRKQFAEAEELINEKYGKELLSKKIEIQVNDNVYTLDYKSIEARYNIHDVVKEAFSYGKQGNVIEKYKLIKGDQKKEYKLSFAYSSKPIDELVNKIEQEVNRNAENAKISITNGNIIITPEVNGVKLEKDKLKEAIIAQINGELTKESIRINAPIVTVKPGITQERLSTINSPIASFSTSFSASTANRINNIQLATSAINGTVLMPGETFSFNEIVGERTAARGYKAAGVIIGDKIESGLGGGICQVSSTLYNAMLRSGIKASERMNHTLPLSYAPKGLDATVDWGNIDLKFKNTLNTPIYIEGYTQNRNVYFNIYSNEGLKKRSYEMVTEVSIIQPTIKYIDDSNRLAGENLVVKNASNGYKAKVYRKTFENRKLINTELISNDYYTPVNGEIIRGIKK